MRTWPKFPSIYEINTWVWLSDLSRSLEDRLTLADIPQEELKRIASYGFDGVWLMGVWERSPGARQVAQDHPDLQGAYQEALPDFAPEDVVASPYAVFHYRVDPALGGDHALVVLRERLDGLGLRLMLDFVPNHMALDHMWVRTHPSRLMQGDPDKLAQEPANYFRVELGGKLQIYAHGRDPYFAGWTDTVQVDYRSVKTRRAMTDILLSIAERCDGVRCDMAMLLTHDVFLRTWGGQFEPPAAEFWPEAINELKASYPDFLMLAEVYWDMEWVMQQQGFDYAYDKRLYDRLLHENASSIRSHLTAGMDYQAHLARFIENHDEERAAKGFGVQRSKVAAVLSLTLPGLRLLHEGQLDGRQVKLPVQLGRRVEEDPVESLERFYSSLLDVLRHPVFRDGEWTLLEPQPAAPGSLTFESVVAFRWQRGGNIRMIIANLSDQPVQLKLPIAWPIQAEHNWLLCDLMSDTTFRQGGETALDHGLHIELPGYGYYIFEIFIDTTNK